jgi:signal transduction histidine kinase/ActR/RegA family two-component response regulator
MIAPMWKLERILAPPPLDGDERSERINTLHRLVVTGLVLLAVMLLASIALRPSEAWQHFPYAGMLAEHALVLAILRRRHLRTAVALHAALYLAVVIVAMVLQGGVRAPAGFVLPPIVLLVGLTWNARAALVTALAASASMLGLVVLEQQGRIQGIVAQQEPIRMWMVATGALAITGVILHVALSILHRSRAELVAKEEARRALEERLEQSRRIEAVGRLAAGVAHDFGNLLTVISAYVGQLGRHRDPEVLAAAAATREAAERGSSLTRQLLAYGRGQVREPEAVDVQEFLRSHEKLFARFLGDDVRLLLDLEATPAVARVDRTQLEQVMLNLISNARDALPGGGAVVLRTRSAPDTVRISVTDTGLGMSAEVQARIFEPFFSTKGRRGTGLGLATVRSIVEESGGRVEVESTLGRGSSFTIVLPAEQPTGVEPAPALPRVSSPAPRAPAPSASVLVVDDDEYVREAVGTILADAGQRARFAATVSSAIDALLGPDGPPDLLLIDVVMPDMPGPELAALLREHHPGLRVLFMSGYLDDRLSVQGVLAGGVHLIRKPFDGPTLLEKVRTVLTSDNAGEVAAPVGSRGGR